MERNEMPPVIAAEVQACKICGASAPGIGQLDFNRCCGVPGSPVLPPAGVAIAYHRCPRCGFLFSGAFDGWGAEDYRRHIYNAGYAAVDPDYATVRPLNNVGLLDRLFAGHKAVLSVLDYGGGNGLLGQDLLARGFKAARTYDPFTPAHAELPDTLFDVVCCFETLEHVPDPMTTIATIGGFVKTGGMVVFSTLVLPPDFEAHGLGWWYVAPRNGHISIFSAAALRLAWSRDGFQVVSLNDNFHLAFREPPAFARHFLRPAS